MFSILEEVKKYKNVKAVQIHTAQHSMLEPPFGAWILAEAFPDISFIIGHPMMSMIQLDNMAAVVKHCPNIYLTPAAHGMTTSPLNAYRALGQRRQHHVWY